jgi:hypothetical protein
MEHGWPVSPQQKPLGPHESPEQQSPAPVQLIPVVPHTHCLVTVSQVWLQQSMV